MLHRNCRPEWKVEKLDSRKARAFGNGLIVTVENGMEKKYRRNENERKERMRRMKRKPSLFFLNNFCNFDCSETNVEEH